MSRPDHVPIVNGVHLSHGTLELRTLARSKRFYKAFLGLTCVRHHEQAQVLASGDQRWFIACVQAGTGVHPQGRENRWFLELHTRKDVDAAHDAAMLYRTEFDIQRIDPVIHTGRGPSFCLQDCDGNWWEIGHRASAVIDTGP